MKFSLFVAFNILVLAGQGQLSFGWLFDSRTTSTTARPATARRTTCRSVSGIENCVDKQLIERLEGFRSRGYVPKDRNGNPHANSGVTIGSGIDLKQKTRSYFTRIGVSRALIDKLQPYFGLKGRAAQNYLNRNPLVLTRHEAESLSSAVMKSEIKRVEIEYNNKVNSLRRSNPDLDCFNELTNAQRTVTCSVLFQYGSTSRVPRFWRFVTSQDWTAVEGELRNFGDDFSTRRRTEANYLARDSGANSCARRG